MNVQEEQSGEASDGGNTDEDSNEGGAEDSGGSDSLSDLERDVQSGEESERPEQEPRPTPGERATGRGQEAREAARTELPYMFAGDKLGFS